MTQIYITIFDSKTNLLIEELVPYTLKNGGDALRKFAELSGETFHSVRDKYNYLNIGSASTVYNGKIFQLNRIKVS